MIYYLKGIKGPAGSTGDVGHEGERVSLTLCASYVCYYKHQITYFWRVLNPELY